MVRIYVLGGGGSGKTTLGTLLGERLGCPVVHLDDAFAFLWRDALPQDARHARADATIRALAAGESWVIEGNFPGWIDEFADRADLVVWLDVPFRVAAWRIVARHVLADLGGHNPYPGYGRLWRFLRNTRRYDGDTEATYRARRAQHPDRWSGVDYGRAAVAAHTAAAGDRVLHVTRGRPHQIVGAVLARLGPGGKSRNERYGGALRRKSSSPDNVWCQRVRPRALLPCRASLIFPSPSAPPRGCAGPRRWRPVGGNTRPPTPDRRPQARRLRLLEQRLQQGLVVAHGQEVGP